jgi:NAD(P)-dependent dehydrogenase (short-subunit alcohol dehydrogenase family)
MFEVNSLGPLFVTKSLLGNLSAGSKVGIITSRMGSIDDNDSGGSYAYRMSKTAVNAAGKSLSIDLKPQGIAVAILHPGWVRTEMTGHGGLIDPDESAAGLIQRMEELTIDTSGNFWHTNGELLPW